MRVEFEGGQYDFPDDASDEEVSSALKKFHPASWGETLKAVPRTALGGVQKGVGGTLQAVAESRPNAGEGRLGGPRKGEIPRPSPTAEAGAGIFESGALNIEEAHPGELSYWKRAVLSGTASVAQQVPALALSIAMRGAGAPSAAAVIPPVATAAILQGGETYGENRAQGRSPARSAGHAAIDATAEAIFEVLPTKFLLDNVGGPVGKLIIGTLIREVPTEMLTTAVQSANAKYSTRPDMTWEEYFQDILDTAGSTVIAAPMLGGTAAVLNRVLPSTQAPAVGGDNAPLSEPSPPAPDLPAFDQPTAAVPSESAPNVDALIKSIDAELLTDEDVTKAQEVLAKNKAAKLAPPIPEAGTAWSSILAANTGEIGADVSEMGATLRQASKHLEYKNPNDAIDRWDRTFLLSSNQEAEGKSPRQVMPQAGTYLLGQESDDRPEGLMRAYFETFEEWRQKHLPNATFVIANESLDTGTTLGMHYSSEPGKHFFVPAVLRSPKKGLGSFNKNTQAGVFYNATHEFGHALINDKFFEGLQPEVAGAIRRASEAGIVPENLISSLPEDRAAVIREFNSIKSRIIGNTINAQELVDTWLGPAKLGRKFLEQLKVAPTDTGSAVLKAIVGQQIQAAEREGLGKSAIKALRQKTKNEYFGLDEYLAEQLARAAYQQKWDQKTPLGKFFAGALKSLRDFFIDAKKDGVIRPGVAFSDWLAGLSKADKVVNEASRTSEGKVRGGEKKAKAKAKVVVETKPKTAKKQKVKIEKVQHNVETATDEQKATTAKKLTTNLVRSGVVEANSPEFKELLGYIRDKDWDAFSDRFSQLAGKTAKFELDPEVAVTDFGKIWSSDLSVLRAGIPAEMVTNPRLLADAERDWKEKQFDSPFFKSWFGDWREDQANASKILSQEGLPLVLWHASDVSTVGPGKAPFDTFALGDLGFHFGTLRAAHVRKANLVDEQIPNLETMYAEFEKEGQAQAKNDGTLRASMAQGVYFIPTVLNMRNPLTVGPENASWWVDPAHFLTYLFKQGILTRSEAVPAYERIALLEKDPLFYRDDVSAYLARKFKIFEPVRQLLVAKGYDGVIYGNLVEGDTSYVAFHPNQVKSLLGAKTFSRSDNFRFDTDFDLAREEGAGASKLFKGTKNWLADMGPLRRALRKVQQLAPHVLQIQQLAHIHPEIEGLQKFAGSDNIGYNTSKSRLQAPADAVVREWSSPFLGKENYAKIGNVLNAELDGGELWFELTKTPQGYRYAMSEKAGQELKARGIDISTPEGEELAGHVLAAKNALMVQLNGLEDAFETILKNRYASSGMDVLIAAMKPMKRAVHQIRKSPFFPRGHFGNMVLTVQHKKDVGPGWETVYKESFESRAKWEEAFNKTSARLKPDERLRKYELSDREYVLMGLPLDFVDIAASELGLSDEDGPNGEPSQVARLMELLQPAKIEKPLKQYDLDRLKIKGYSADALRSFAAFTWHNANLIAKLKYRSEFNASIRAVDADLRKAQYSQEPESIEATEKVGRLKRAMESARDYIMAPENEAQALRTFVSVAYLGLNPKTAVINFYGLITNWSDLTTKHGMLEGNKIFLKGMAKAISSINLTDLNAATDLGFMTSDEKAALSKALEEGVLSQSYAYHLAGMANAGTLWRMPATNVLSKIVHAGVDLAMWPFRLTELSSRRAAFLSLYESEKLKPSEELSNPYDAAVKATSLQMNDYSHGNRVPFMRGNALHLGPIMPVATIFMSFAQHMAFHSYGGYELGQRRMAALHGESPRSALGGYTMKIWLITLLLAGYEGLPGAENILDLISAAWRKWGDGEPIRKKLREYVQALEIDWLSPGLAAHGLGYNLGGFDVSRSIGFGRFIPGTDVLAHPRGDPEEQVGDLVLDMMGPAGGFLKFGLGALTGPKSTAEAFERLPGGLGNIYNAYRWDQQGVRAADGSLVTIDKKTGKLRDLTAVEIVGKAFGLNPTVVSENRQIRFEQYDQQMYWQSRRKALLDDIWRAKWQKDREAEADARKAVSDFNASIPAKDRVLKITGADIAKSIQTHQQRKRMEEQGKAPERRFRPLYKDIRESHE